MYIIWFLVVYLTYFMKPVKETIFSSKIHKAFFANIRNDCVFSVIRNKQYSYAIRVWALSSWFPFHLQITGKRKLYKFHRNRKWVLNIQVYYFFLSMCTLYEVCAIWARICSTSEAYHQYQWEFLVQVKCIISMNEIWSAARNIIKFWKREAIILYNTLARYFLLSMNCTCL